MATWLFTRNISRIMYYYEFKLLHGKQLRHVTIIPLVSYECIYLACCVQSIFQNVSTSICMVLGCV